MIVVQINVLENLAATEVLFSRYLKQSISIILIELGTIKVCKWLRSGFSLNVYGTFTPSMYLGFNAIKTMNSKSSFSLWKKMFFYLIVQRGKHSP